MSESEEDFAFIETGDFTSSSFNSNISGLIDYDEVFGSPSLSTVLDQPQLNNCTLSSETTVFDNSDGSISCSSVSLVASESPELLNKITTVQGASQDKVLEYKALLEQLNDTYTMYKTSEFLIGCAKESSKKMLPQVRAKVQNILANCAAYEHVTLKRSNDGESFNILGLRDEHVKSLNETSLSPLEKIEFDKHMSETIKRKVQELKKQIQTLIDTFHLSDKNTELTADTMLMEAHTNYIEILEELQNQLARATHLMEDICETILNVAQLNEDSGSELPELSYSLLRQKTVFLSALISKFKHQVDSKMYGDHKYKRVLNEYGEMLKLLIEDARYELDSLKASLDVYKEKEDVNEKYKTIVEEYSKVKKELQRKDRMLTMLFTDSPET